ncbi:PREDICTED: monocarboxylate transporter 1-like [Priapulus caudatus]|uniref:Monocarboxylate transporter 1-like n=1 Tax=Priapulus caudatus TaxID=37621 RepID=A0ABM1EVX2_PRICU|nr:PREDICTED: monocarboxylate transporter 1-like [Priapulus caudatus]
MYLDGDFRTNRSVTAWASSNCYCRPIRDTKTVIAAYVVAAFACAGGAFAPNISTLIISCGVIAGACGGITFVAGVAIIGEYFEIWQGMAFAIASTGIGIAPLMLAPLQQYLIDVYTWRGALFISAGVLLNGCVVGAIMRDPPTDHKTLSAKELLQASCNKYQLNDIIYIIFCIFNFMHMFGVSASLVLLYDHLESQSYTPERASWSFTMWGILNICGKLFTGVLIHTKQVSQCSVHVLYTAQAMLGAFFILLALPGQVYLYYDVILSFYGFVVGMTAAAWPTVCVDLFGQKKLMATMGWLLLCQGAGCTIGAPIGGRLNDAFQTTSAAYYMAGCVSVISSLFVLVLLPIGRHNLEKERRRRYVTVTSESSQFQEEIIV